MLARQVNKMDLLHVLRCLHTWLHTPHMEGGSHAFIVRGPRPQYEACPGTNRLILNKNHQIYIKI